jgi:hypothetical protein
MKSKMPFIVQWSEGAGDKCLNWWVKSVEPNRFFGEITDCSRSLQINLEGLFLDGDLAEVEQLIQDIRRLCDQTPTTSNGSYSLLALGTRTKPEIVFRYSKGSETTDESAALFLRIVDILRKYVESTLDSAKSA